MLNHSAVSEPTAMLVQTWWQNFSSKACSLPQEQTQGWLDLISTFVRNYHRLLHSSRPADQRLYRERCQDALAKSRWELMLISMYGYIPQQEMAILQELQASLEKSLQN